MSAIWNIHCDAPWNEMHKVLEKDKIVRIKQVDGTWKYKIGDGDTPIDELPYVPAEVAMEHKRKHDEMIKHMMCSMFSRR